MDHLETRELRYFIAVAEELHFGRAADRLSIAQPALSKTIRRMESRLKVQLLRRSSRSVTLTPSGAALLEHGRHALSAMTIAVQAAQRVGHNQPLRLVMKPGGDADLLSGILTAYAQQPHARQVDILFSGSTDRSEYLLRGLADVGLLYAPFDDLTGLAVKTLHTEDRVAVLPDTHHLASRTAISLEELTGEPFPRWRGVPPDSLDQPTGGAEPNDDLRIGDVAELAALVRIGRAVAVLPRSLVMPTPPGIACVTVEDTRPSRIVIARRESDHRDSVIALIRAATAITHSEC